MTPIVSVVTPFHDSAEYLAECIESVLAQDLGDFEYLLVDNRSTDDGGSIAAEFARQDRRIRLERTSRLLPQVENYNHALRSISPQSRFCKVVQADDWIFPTCLSSMVDLATGHPSVGVVGAYELQDRVVAGSYLPPDMSVVEGREAGRMHMLDDAHVFGSPTTVMYRADLVRSRPDFYDVGRIHEDTEVVFELLRVSDFGFVHQVLSYSRRQPGSFTDLIKDYLTQKLDEMIVVDRYGPDFLSADELDACSQRKQRNYYRALARRWLKEFGRWDPDFWSYQRDALATIDREVEPVRIARELLPGLAEWLWSSGRR